MTISTNIHWQKGLLTREARWNYLRTTGCTVWLTGLPSSGKSTIASAVECQLVKQGLNSFNLDGDNIRHGLNYNLGFSSEDRQENIRRITEVAKLFAESGCIIITSFISPYSRERELAREIHVQANLAFYEIFIDAPLEVCKQRDPKGLYKKALAGELKGFTGIDDPYERPLQPDLIIDTVKNNIEECSDKIIRFILT